MKLYYKSESREHTKQTILSETTSQQTQTRNTSK